MALALPIVFLLPVLIIGDFAAVESAGIIIGVELWFAVAVAGRHVEGRRIGDGAAVVVAPIELPGVVVCAVAGCPVGVAVRIQQTAAVQSAAVVLPGVVRPAHAAARILVGRAAIRDVTAVPIA